MHVAGLPRADRRFRGQRLGLQLVLRRSRGLRPQPEASRHRLPQCLRPLPGRIRDTGSPQDGVQFHYHPHNFRREANHQRDALVGVLRQPRPRFSVAGSSIAAGSRPPHRAGFHVIRPDSHWFLEQHIPFDLSSQAVAAVADDSAQSGLDDGRWGDWRRAPPPGSPTTRPTTTTRSAGRAAAGSPAVSTSGPATAC